MSLKVTAEAEYHLDGETKRLSITLTSPGGIVSTLMMPLSASEEADEFMESLPALFDEAANVLLTKVAAEAGVSVDDLDADAEGVTEASE